MTSQIDRLTKALYEEGCKWATIEAGNAGMRPKESGVGYLCPLPTLAGDNSQEPYLMSFRVETPTTWTGIRAKTVFTVTISQDDVGD